MLMDQVVEALDLVVAVPGGQGLHQVGAFLRGLAAGQQLVEADPVGLAHPVHGLAGTGYVVGRQDAAVHLLAVESGIDEDQLVRSAQPRVLEPAGQRLARQRVQLADGGPTCGLRLHRGINDRLDALLRPRLGGVHLVVVPVERVRRARDGDLVQQRQRLGERCVAPAVQGLHLAQGTGQRRELAGALAEHVATASQVVGGRLDDLGRLLADLPGPGIGQALGGDLLHLHLGLVQPAARRVVGRGEFAEPARVALRGRKPQGIVDRVLEVAGAPHAVGLVNDFLQLLGLLALAARQQSGQVRTVVRHGQAPCWYCCCTPWSVAE